MITNNEVASHLYELARLITLAEGGGNVFRVRAYETASQAVEGYPEAVAEMSVADFTALRGVGKGTASKIRELVDSGRVKGLEELHFQFPSNFLVLTRVPGVGRPRQNRDTWRRDRFLERLSESARQLVASNR